MTRKRKDYMMSEGNINYIEEVKKDNHLKYSSEALDLIIREHMKNSSMSTEAVIKIIGDRISEKLQSEMIGMKRASNAADKNTQIVLELLNGFCLKNGYNKLATTDIDISTPLKDSRNVVEKRIESKRVSKLARKY